MATSTGRRSLAPIGLVLAVGLSGCATATPNGSGSPADSSSAASSRSVATSAATGVPVATSVRASSPVPGSSFPVPATLASVGTQASIPEAPVSAGTQEAGATTPAEPASVVPITSDAGVVATPLPDCNPGTLKTLVPGRLTFAAGSDARRPWFIGDDPASGQGYEAALARAVASQLSYPSTAVTWAASDLGQVKAGKATGFDIALGEFPTPNGADAPVDYSTGYFSISDSVVARAGTEAAGRTKLGELKTLRVGAISGSTGLGSAKSQIAAARTTAYPSATVALAALAAGSVDALVLPTPTALAAGSSVVVLGQLPEGREQPVQFGMVLAKNSPLTGCVSAAIDQLRITGKLKALVAKWVPAAAKPLS